MSLPDPALRSELRSRLRSLRLARGLSQAQLGVLLGVNQKRIARIEAAPDLASLGQIQRLVLLLNGSIQITDTHRGGPVELRSSLKQGRGRPAGATSGGAAAKPGRTPRVASALAAEALPSDSGREEQTGTGWSAAWD